LTLQWQLVSLRGELEDPRRRRQTALAGVALLSWLTLLTRLALDVDGVLDIDTLNFGLAALRFDVLAHQPQPPGYPGYVVLLKAIHVIAPGLGPAELAKWGSRLCSVATVPASYWACRGLLAARAPAAQLRPLAAATFAACHPVLWYYGADGQSHAAEALSTVLLLGAVVRAHRTPSLSRLLAVVAAFGAAGALRPTIPLLSSPLLVWLFWRRPLRDWALAVAVGASAVAAWAAPLIAAVGGWDLYRRANRALVSEVFIANYSLLSPRAHPLMVLHNVQLAAYAAVISLLPALAWAPGRRGEDRWRRAWLALVAVNIVFYAVVYIGELGYLTAVASLACLAPASWPTAVPRGLAWRAAAALVAGLAWFGLGPDSLPIYGSVAEPSQTLARVVGFGQLQTLYREAVCDAAAGAPALALTDNPTTTHTRPVPLHCPNVAFALYLHAMPFEPERALDTWLVFYPDTMHALPTGVPLEPGPRTEARLRAPVDRIILAPDASPEFVAAIADQASCAPHDVDADSGLALRWLPARCLPAIESPSVRLDVSW
jgi:hypothetical protein